jgi:hypothetical protein
VQGSKNNGQSPALTEGYYKMHHAIGRLFRLETLVATVALAVLSIGTAVAQDSDDPFKRAAYWEVSSIHVKDGSGLKYANHLAKNWVRNQEFAKSKGWISGYYVLANAYPREGEPDVYLVTIFKEMATAEENEKRNKEWLEHEKSTNAQMEAESGARAEYRTLGGNMLLMEMVKR